MIVCYQYSVNVYDSPVFINNKDLGSAVVFKQEDEGEFKSWVNDYHPYITAFQFKIAAWKIKTLK